jgi:hypothetical protein
MRKSVPHSKRQITSRRRFRPLLLEPLEMRACPSFDSQWLPTATPPTLVFNGTKGDDILTNIFVASSGTIWFTTNDGQHPTEAALTGGQLAIFISGRSGNDKVILGTNSFFGSADMPGFPKRYVFDMVFYGGPGNDVFQPPQGIVKLAPPGTQPNIRFYGGDGSDKLLGRADPEYFDGQGDTDSAEGGGGNDWLYGGPNLDTLSGGPGDDIIDGGDNTDILDGGADNDSISGGTGHDIINGGPGDDEIDGGDGNDTIKGGDGDDTIFGGAGSDAISGGNGDDTIYTGPSTAPNASLPDGGLGDPDWPPNLPDNTYFEIVAGNDGSDSIYATLAGGKTYLDGGDGQDTIFGSDFDDEIHGGPKTDWLGGGLGWNKVYGDGGDDFIGAVGEIWGGDDNDTITGGEMSDDIIHGGPGDDVITSGDPSALEGSADQPYNGVGRNPTFHDMLGAGGDGEAESNRVDGHIEPNPYNVPDDQYYRRLTLLDQLLKPPLPIPLTIAAPGLLPPGAISVRLVNDVTHGSLTLNTEDGSYTYVPNGGFVGDDAFSYVANDGRLDSNEATVTIRVRPANAVPGPTFTVPKVTPLKLQVPAGGLLDGLDNSESINVTSGPSDGTLDDWNADGSFTYTPDSGYVGTDSFFYVGLDSNGDPNTDPIFVEVDVPDYSPHGFDDSYDSAPGAATSDSAPGLLSNDNWADTATLSTQAASGTAVVNPDGSFTYTPNAGFSGTDTFQYIAQDSATGHTSAPSTVTVYVSPIAASDREYPMASSDTSLNVPASDGLLPSGADTTELIEDDGPVFGTVTLNPDGSFDYTPQVGFIGTDSFDYYAENTATGDRSVPTTVNINIGPHAADDDYSVGKNNSLLITASSLLLNDSQANDVQITEQPTNGTLTDHHDGTFTYHPSTDFSGDDVFEYSAVDAAGNVSLPALVTIHVIDLVANPDTYSAAWGTKLVSAPGVLANDTSGGNNIAVKISPLSPNIGTLNYFHSDGSFSYTAPSGSTGSVTFQYVVLNTATGLYSAPTTVTINIVQPVAVADSYVAYKNTNFHKAAAEGVLSNDSNADTAIRVSLPNATQGTVTLNSDGSFDFIPISNFTGTTSFTYKAHNTATNADSATVTVSIQVKGVPFAVADTYPVLNDYPHAFDAPTPGILGNDKEAVSATLVTGTAHGVLGWDHWGPGLFNYIPNYGFTGTDTFQYKATNPAGSSQVVTVTLNVHGPVAANADLYTIAPGGTLSVTGQGVRVNDIWSSTVQIVPNSGPYHQNGAFTLNANGTFTYQPDASFGGFDSFQYIAIDADGNLSSPATVSITTSSPPHATADEYWPTDVGYTTGTLNIPAPGVLQNDQYANAVEVESGGAIYGLNTDGSIYITPDPSWFLGYSGGDEAFIYRAVNTVTGQKSDPVQAVIHWGWWHPIARDDSFDAIAGFQFSGNAAANDAWAVWWPRTYYLIVPPSNGSFSWTGGGGFNYTQNSGFVGTDSFEYQTSQLDNGVTLWSSVARVTINFVGIQPIAVADEFTAEADISGGVSWNDQWANAWSQYTQPTDGLLTFNSNGTFTYTPTSGYVGDDSFQYRAVNTAMGYQSSPTTVVLHITGQDAVAVDDDYEMTSDQGTLHIDAKGVLDNDAFGITAISAGSGPANGTVTLNSDGSFTYTPNDGFEGDDSFQYIARSTNGHDSLPAMVVIHVYSPPSPDDPQASDDYYWITIGQTLEVSASGILGNDSYADSVILVNGPNIGSLTLNDDGSFTYIPEDSFTGTVSFTYKAVNTADHRRPSEATVTIEVDDE